MLSSPCWTVLLGIIMGFGEEIGYRSFMFPQLFKIKPQLGIFIGGLIWFAWHLPLPLVIPQTAQYPLWQNSLNFIPCSLHGMYATVTNTL